MKTLSRKHLMLPMALLFASSATLGEEPPVSNEELLNSQRSTPTSQLLELQRSGKLATRNEQHLPGRAQSKIHERYINSFGHAIPETYINEEFSE